MRLAHGGVWVDRWRASDGAMLVTAGTVLTIHLPPGGSYPTVELEAHDILYEDAALIVLNKPPGWYVTMTPWDLVGNVRAALERWLQRRDGVLQPVHLAHQLDRDTSGVLIATKDPQANAGLQRSFATHTVSKRYLCICAGQPVEDSWTTETGHGRGAHGLFRVYPLEQVGQPLPVGHNSIKYMATDFRVVRRFAGTALLEASPRTGRTHQIRLHLHALGYPILGDARYGGPLQLGDLPLTHHLLHAEYIRLPHPLTHHALEVAAPLSPLFTRAWEELEQADGSIITLR
ncbi:MAG: RluA family pseudouridine synthase [Herpetosiphonaceae bacterium]|nr:RluA family pseudouridine synthase [Herpetosiphonaceae bacterium]